MFCVATSGVIGRQQLAACDVVLRRRVVRGKRFTTLQPAFERLWAIQTRQHVEGPARQHPAGHLALVRRLIVAVNMAKRRKSVDVVNVLSE